MSSYYLTNAAKRIYYGATLLALVLTVVPFLYLIPVLCFQFYFFAFGLFGLFVTIKRAREEHIVVSEKGIEYHTTWLSITAKWTGIQRLSINWHNGFWYECLLVNNSETRISKWSFPEGSPPVPFKGMYSKTIFPISCYAENWRDTELGQEIKQYAPHLFEESAQSVETSD